jgi:signal transduction histidine kinase
MPVRPQDFAWLLLYGALAFFGPERTPEAMALLACFAVLQVVESRIPFFSTERGNLVSIGLKLALAYVLIGFTGGVASSYYFILLVPVVSATTTLNSRGAIAFTLAGCAAYLSFLAFIDWRRQFIPVDQMKELLLRIALLPVVGLLAHQLAGATRERASGFQAMAEELAEANRHLQDAEAAVRRADRLAALGQLTAGLAHELRNPMTTIRSSAEVLGRSIPQTDEVARELAGYIVAEVDRANSLISRFLDFARPTNVRLAPADLTAVIDRAIALVHREAAYADTPIYTNYSPDAGLAHVDAELMERVVFNLVLNAVQASPPGGAVTVKLRSAGQNAEISVIDRGHGVDPKKVESIFNPFVTTKPGGVGLGLAIVSKIVDEHGGKIVVESGNGEGSVFRVYIPVRPRET